MACMVSTAFSLLSTDRAKALHGNVSLGMTRHDDHLVSKSFSSVCMAGPTSAQVRADPPGSSSKSRPVSHMLYRVRYGVDAHLFQVSQATIVDSTLVVLIGLRMCSLQMKPTLEASQWHHPIQSELKSLRAIFLSRNMLRLLLTSA